MPSPPRSSRSSDLGGWILRAGVAAFYIAFGADKLGSDPHNSWVRIFEHIGLGQWFRVATAVIEIGAGTLYLVPMTCKPAAVLLSLTMLGAILAHLSVLGDPGASVIPAAALVATILIALREPDSDPRHPRDVRRAARRPNRGVGTISAQLSDDDGRVRDSGLEPIVEDDPEIVAADDVSRRELPVCPNAGRERVGDRQARLRSGSQKSVAQRLDVRGPSLLRRELPIPEA